MLATLNSPTPSAPPIAAQSLVPPEVLKLFTLLVNDAQLRKIPAYARTALGNRVPPYSCVGCVERLENRTEGHRLRTVNHGKLTAHERSLLWDTLLQPTLKAAVEQTMVLALTICAYRPHATEPGVNGPGGVVCFSPDATSASLALLFWDWQDEATFQPLLPEAEAKTALWQRITAYAPEALAWLQRLAPGEHRIPHGLRHQVHPLLATPAWQQLLQQQCGVSANLTALNTLTID
ncbi:MAG: hypothetical protein INF43_04930 [Alphaproteobacteria bacterium]|jgi:hypothetical protein|nr:hypothetical protein [Alphaproteobacteria bacterium]